MNSSNSNETYAHPLWNRASTDSFTHMNQTPKRVPYQVTLRGVGAYLDERSAHSVNVLEDESGFTVRFATEPSLGDAGAVKLSNVELLALTYQRDRKRRRKSFPFGRVEEASHSDCYENRLRAIGYELDSVGAYSVLLDELEDGWLVTYQFLRPTDGFNAHKRMVILGHSEMQAVLDDALERRDRRKQGILTMLAS